MQGHDFPKMPPLFLPFPGEQRESDLFSRYRILGAPKVKFEGRKRIFPWELGPPRVPWTLTEEERSRHYDF